MVTKFEIYSLAEKVVKDYPDWTFEKSSGRFKNKRLKHTILIISPTFSFRNGFCNGTPYFGIYNNTINKLYEELLNTKLRHTTISYQITLPKTTVNQLSANSMEKTIINLKDDKPEEWIQAFLNRGIEKINETFDLSSETSILKTLPKYYRNDATAKVCIAKCMLGDFEFAYKLKAGEIVNPDEHPFNEELLNAVIAKIPEWEKEYQEKGYLVRPLR